MRFRLRLTGMAEALEQQWQHASAAELGFDERLGLLVDHEVLYRENRRLTRLLKGAKLRINACVEDIDYRQREAPSAPKSRPSRPAPDPSPAQSVRHRTDRHR